MLVIIINQSKKKSFLKSKRLISSVLPEINLRINLGDIPKRVLMSLLKELRLTASRATNLKIFIESKKSYHGFKCVEIGKPSFHLEPFTTSSSTFDTELFEVGFKPLLFGTMKNSVKNQ